ncbi:MAG: adenine nucleotide alpha hydrolase family protein [Anaerolineae bacterium]
MREQTVWSCGGGVDSAAMAILILTGRLPKPDVALMVDGGFEKQATWQFVRGTLMPALEAIGVMLHVVDARDFGRMRLFDDAGGVLMPAYRLADGKVTKLATHCCSRWKERPVERWLTDHGVIRYQEWLGIAADETRRARESRRLAMRRRYPLIEAGLDREACVWSIGRYGWPRVVRSSCVMCPQHSDAEWLQLKHCYPGDWERAVRVERAIRRRDPTVFLHRSCVPLPDVQFRG